MLPLQSAEPRPYQRPSLLGELEHRHRPTRPRRAAAGRRSGSTAARSARPRAPGAWPCTQFEPSGVGDSGTSCRPAAANASTTQSAAFSHSSGGNCFGSATDLNETSSARSSLAGPSAHGRPGAARSTGMGFLLVLMLAGAGLSRDRVDADRGRRGARRPARLRRLVAAQQGDEQDAGRGQIAIVSAEAPRPAASASDAESPAASWLFGDRVVDHRDRRRPPRRRRRSAPCSRCRRPGRPGRRTRRRSSPTTPARWRSPARPTARSAGARTPRTPTTPGRTRAPRTRRSPARTRARSPGAPPILAGERRDRRRDRDHRRGRGQRRQPGLEGAHARAPIGFWKYRLRTYISPLIVPATIRIASVAPTSTRLRSSSRSTSGAARALLDLDEGEPARRARRRGTRAWRPTPSPSRCPR